MRCLTLADQLKARGGVCHFISRRHEGNINHLVVDRGHILHELSYTAEKDIVDVGAPAHIEWLGVTRQRDAQDCIELLSKIFPEILIVDHYSLDEEWDALMRPYCQRLVVIDDLADRPHVCDLLIDQNLGRTAIDYAGLVPELCTLLCGPEYALLRPEFAAHRESSLARRLQGALHSITIAMGGVDSPNATGKVLRALLNTSLPYQVNINVLMGATAPWIGSVREAAAQLPWPVAVHVGVSNVGEILANTDLVIGAAGGSAWERCALGVPTLVVVLAENQRAGAQALAEHGAAICLGEVSEIENVLPSTIDSLLIGDRLRMMSLASAELADGNGVKNIMSELDILLQAHPLGIVRKMTESDLGIVLAWRNHPNVRRYMYSQQEISWDAHVEWFKQVSLDSRRHILIYESQDKPTGFVSFCVKEGKVADWGFYLAPGSAKGTGRKLGEAALNYAFKSLGLHKVCGEVLEYNLSSIRFHEKMGFESEGCLRQHHFNGSDYNDIVLFGLLAEDWAIIQEGIR